MPRITIKFTDNDDSFRNETGYIDEKKVRDFTTNLLERLTAKLAEGFTSMSGPVESANGETLGHYHITLL